MPVIFSDDFNRANAALTTPWSIVIGSPSASLSVISNTLADSGASNANDDTALVSVGQSNQIVSATVAVVANPGLGLIARAADLNNFYLLNITLSGSSTFFDVYKKVAGAFTQLGSTTNVGGVSIGDTIRFSVIGSTYETQLNGVVQSTGTDSSIGSGTSAGVRSNGGSNAGRYDNFTVSDISQGGITLGGSATGAVGNSATGSITLGGSATGFASNPVLGSITLSGSGTARGGGPSAGSITLGGAAVATANTVFFAWSADDTQQCLIETVCSATATVNVPVTAPPAGVAAVLIQGRHVVMGTLTLDANMQPVQPWTFTYA